jgi:hypothetical protein
VTIQVAARLRDEAHTFGFQQGPLNTRMAKRPAAAEHPTGVDHAVRRKAGRTVAQSPADEPRAPIPSEQLTEGAVGRHSAAWNAAHQSVHFIGEGRGRVCRCSRRCCWHDRIVGQTSTDGKGAGRRSSQAGDPGTEPVRTSRYSKMTPRAPFTRRALLRAGAATLASLGLAACAAPSPPPAPTPATRAKPSGPTLILATSELVVGRNRFAVAIVDETNKPIVDARVTFGFYQLAGNEGTKRAEAPATFRWVEQQAKGIYTAPVEFDASGKWGVEATVELGTQRQMVRSSFDVKATGSAPVIGSPAVRSKTLTPSDVKDPTELCTAATPCELHATSLDQLLATGRPTVVLFASPGFCSSATCAPQLGVLLDAKPRHADAVTFAHVEIYKDPRNQLLADAVTEWKLPSEPWMFFIDKQGIIAERFDGIATAEEIDVGIAQIV